MARKVKIDHKKLEKRITALSDALARLGSADDFKKLILIIKRPGWTTPAEFLFAQGLVETMIVHADALAQGKAALLQASDAVAPAEVG